jgi:hypothetical protein
MLSGGSWSVVCGDFAGRERMLQVLVRGDEVVIVAPAGESAKLGPAAVVEFRSVVEQAAEVANASAVGDPAPRLSWRGGTRPWASGPAAMLAAGSGG